MSLDGGYAPNDFTFTGELLEEWPRDDLELALAEITANVDGYDHAQEYDEINLWEQNMISREGRTLRQADIEFDPNFCSPVIDALNDRLIITSVTATAGADTDTEASDAATKALAQVMKATRWSRATATGTARPCATATATSSCGPTRPGRPARNPS